MKNTIVQSLLFVTLVSTSICTPAQSFLDVADASLDALRENREQNAAPSEVRAIFAKAKTAADNEDRINLCGFYTGMSVADAQTLAGYYNLQSSEWSIEGNPVYKITLSLKGVRRVTKGGNTFDELAQAVANRVGSLKQDWETKVYSLKTIDGISVTMSESSGFAMVDTGMKTKADQEELEKRLREEREAREARERAEREAREARERAEREAREAREKAEREIREAREAHERAEREVREKWERAARESRAAHFAPTIKKLIEDMIQIPGKQFKIGKTEVTQIQWFFIMETNPSEFLDDEHPVENISWDDCQVFIKKLNDIPTVKESGLRFRLPTEKEWEFACRAGATGNYCKLANGTEISKASLSEVSWFKDNAGSKTHPVGQKKPNAFGLYDMNGNVWEWTSSAKGDFQVYRGGSWDLRAENCTSSSRYEYLPFIRGNFLGLRLCADVQN